MSLKQPQNYWEAFRAQLRQVPEPRSGKTLHVAGLTDFDEEAHNRKRPGEKFPGFVQDLGCKEVKAVWKNYVTLPDGRQGPVFKNNAERKECLRRAGFRATEPGEVPKIKSRAQRMREYPTFEEFMRSRR